MTSCWLNLCCMSLTRSLSICLSVLSNKGTVYVLLQILKRNPRFIFAMTVQWKLNVLSLVHRTEFLTSTRTLMFFKGSAKWLNLFPSTMIGFSGDVVDFEVMAASWVSLGSRGEVGLLGEVLRENEPNTSLVSGKSSTLVILRGTAGLVKLIVGWGADSKVLP